MGEVIIHTARCVNYIGMRSTPVTSRMTLGNVCGAGRVKGLHLHKSEGAWTVKALKHQIRPMRQASAYSLHEGIHASILAWPTIHVHTALAKDSRADTA